MEAVLDADVELFEAVGASDESRIQNDVAPSLVALLVAEHSRQLDEATARVPHATCARDPDSHANR